MELQIDDCSWFPGFQIFSFVLTSCFPAFLIQFAGHARVVKWQTRTFEGRMPKGMRVQVPPRAPSNTLGLSSPTNGQSLPRLAGV